MKRPDMLPPAIHDILAREQLPPHYALICEQYWLPVAARIAEAQAAAGHPLVVGICGPQGSGKSTLCLCLEVLLRETHGLAVATLALDDLYLPRAARLEIAREAHPLFATRGVPGTHDVGLGIEVMERLLSGNGMVARPAFDKSCDDRRPAAEWPRLAAPVEVVLFEGWCVGLSAQPAGALDLPVNALEREEDAGGRWRRAVNLRLETDYAELFAGIGLLLFLRVPGLDPGLEEVRRWRQLQEAKLAARTGSGMTADALDRFVDHYQRLTVHAIDSMPARADILVDIGPDHRPFSLQFRT